MIVGSFKMVVSRADGGSYITGKGREAIIDADPVWSAMLAVAFATGIAVLHMTPGGAARGGVMGLLPKQVAVVGVTA